MKQVADIIMHPVPKARPRVNGKAYTPKETRDAEREFCYLWKTQCDPQPDYIRPVRVSIDVHSVKGRGDLDNYVKLVLDALNHVAFRDDRYVVEIRARRFKDMPEGYHVEVEYL